MITRFFKRKPKAAEPKKKTAAEKPQPAAPREKDSLAKKILTAEGWKRMMMRKSGKSKK